MMNGCSKPNEPANRAPGVPAIDTPSHQSSGQTVTIVLRWSCIDPDGDPLAYDVHFGTSSTPPLVSSGQSETSYATGNLAYGTKYFWRILVRDSHGNTSSSPTWEFTTEGQAILSNGLVSPASGNNGSIFTYSVTYQNATGSEPKMAELVLDGMHHTMSLTSGTISSGATYTYSQSLDEAVHTYSFCFTSGDSQLVAFPSGGYLTGPVVTKPDVTVAPNVFPLDDLDSLQFAGITDSTYRLTFVGTPPVFHSGDIIVGSDDGGYLRKVVDYKVQGSQILLNTTFASLSQAIITGACSTKVPLGFGSSKSYRNGSPITLGEVVSMAPGVIPTGDGFVLDNTVVFDGPVGNARLTVKITRGIISFDPDLDLGWKLDHGIKEFHAVVSGDLKFDADVAVTSTAPIVHSASKTLVQYNYILPTFFVGPVPVIAVAQLSIEAGEVDALDLAATINFDITDTSLIQAGARYDQSSWSGIWENESRSHSSLNLPQMSLGAKAKLFIRPRIDVKLYTVYGPYVYVEPSASLEAKVQSTPPCWIWGLYAGVEAKFGMRGKILDYSFLDFNRSFLSVQYEIAGDSICENSPPSAVTDLRSPNLTSNSAILAWTAPGNDGNIGQASAYDVRYSTSQITEANWSAATQAGGEPAPRIAGSSETFTVTGLSPNTTYYFALKTADEVPNWSGLSNVPSATTPSDGDVTPPAAVTNLAATNPTASAITLTWIAPGDDGNTGTASQYDIRYSTSQITSSNWNSASQATGEPTPRAAGSSETFAVTGLSPNTTYYFALKAGDEVLNWSLLSNLVSATTTGILSQEFVLDGQTLALWHFNESSGSAVVDATINHSNGTCTGTTVGSGKFGNARHLNGTSDYIKVPISPSLEPAGDFTVEGWFKIDDLNASMPNQNNEDVLLSSLTTPDKGGYQIGIKKTASNQYKVFVGIRSASGAADLFGTKFLTNTDNGVWHHMAGVFRKNPIASGGTLYLFLDGVQDGSLATGYNCEYTNINYLYIGTNVHFLDYSRMLGGSIDEVRISNIVRYSPQ